MLITEQLNLQNANQFKERDIMAKHISEKVNALLLEQGWKVDCKGDCAFHAKKRIEGIAEGGTVSNGARVVQLRMCERGR